MKSYHFVAPIILGNLNSIIFTLSRSSVCCNTYFFDQMISKILKFPRRKTCGDAVELVLRWGPTVPGGAPENGVIFNGDGATSEQYLQAVDKIQRLTSGSEDQRRANYAIQIAMARLQNEFEIVLMTLISQLGSNSQADAKASTCSFSITASTTGYEDYDCELSTRSKECVDDLRSIAKRMNSGGHLGKCVKMYASARSSVLEASFQKLCIQKSSINELRKMDWEALEAVVKQWLRAAKICVKILFAFEKRLCEAIFGGIGTGTDDVCFAEIVKDRALHLFKLGEDISISARSPSRRPEKLFKILDLHKALLDLLPDIEDVFQANSLQFIRNKAAEMLPRLADAARAIFLEFETSVLRAQSKFLDPNGGIHPWTTYVLSYISWISLYKKILDKLILSKPSSQGNERNSGDLTMVPDMNLAEMEGRTPLAVHLIWILHILQFKLEGKSRCYKDPSLAQLFLMNNLRGIVQKIEEDFELRQMTGDDYLQKLTENVRQVMCGYQRLTLERVICCYSTEGGLLQRSRSFSSGVSKRALKESLKTFKAKFEEVHHTQAKRLVPDLHLRQQLRRSISEELIPVYSSLLERFESHAGSRNQRQKVIIGYSVEDLRSAISNFFVGNAY